MQLKITSDGTVHGTTVIDTASGLEVPNMTKLIFEANWASNKRPKVSLELAFIPITLEADAGLFTYFNGKRYRMVEEE